MKLTDKFSPIGVVHCELKELKDAPLHWKNSDVEGEIEVFEEFSDGLRGIERFQHLAIIFLFHKAEESRSFLRKPVQGNGPRGVFTTGSPVRPNPIGLSILKLLEVNDNTLKVAWLDMIEGTPVLDIKPFHLDEIKKKLWPYYK
jgi:tRNA-Thr(GGU) m(6)t(6)A37 methyltransferase TsaA